LQYSVVHFPPAQLIRKARRYQEPYAGSLDVAIDPHFTLHPPFESDRSTEELAQVLGPVCAAATPFRAKINGFDTFFGRRFVLFMKLADEGKMAALLEKIDRATTEVDWGDVLEPGTTPRPHLTIGFFDKREEVEQAEAALAGEALELEWTVDRVDLVAEVKPAILQSVRTFQLGG